MRSCSSHEGKNTALLQGYPQQATFSFPLRFRKFRYPSICVFSLDVRVRQGLDAPRLS